MLINHQRIVIITCMALVITSCVSVGATQNIQLNPTLSPTISLSPEVTVASIKPTLTAPPIYPSPTVNPTDTALTETPVEDLHTPVPTNTNSIVTRIMKKCITLEKSLENIPVGALVVEGRFELDKIDQMVLLKIPDFDQRIIEKVHTEAGISPDLKQLAYINVDQNLIKIIDGKGNLIRKIPVNANWRSIVEWVDQNLLLIENMPRYPDGTIKPPASSVFYDFLSQKVQKEYQPDFPFTISFAGGGPDWGSYHFNIAVFSPDIRRVIYPAWNNVDDAPLILWDLENQAEIIRLHGNDPDYGGKPEWLKDGSAFFAGVYPKYISWNGTKYLNIDDKIPYLGGYDLFRIGRDGEIERLTYLTAQYNAAEEGYTLSPDEKSLAFWMNLDYKPRSMEASRSLSILNVETGAITDLCLQGGDVPYYPVWSPDSKYLLVTVSDWSKSIADVILVDIEKGVAVKVADQAVGRGWMLPPEQ